MQVRLSYRHPLVRERPPREAHPTPGSYKFWAECCGPVDCCGVALAWHGHRIVGWFRFRLHPGPTLVGCGTWVHPRWRHRGMAVAMWGHAVRKLRPRAVQVTAVSRNGERLIAALRRQFPDLFDN